MTVVLVEFVVVLVGLVMTAVLFYRLPMLPMAKKWQEHLPSVSVVIPARNEARNLPLLLKDLCAQSWPVKEIICVDDASEDATAQIALSYGVRLISLQNKPQGWTGKTWACQNGADAAVGKLLLFLDADVRLGAHGIQKLISAYESCGCTVSVQPYHQTQKPYEQLSMLFNLVQIAANGTALPKPRNLGLYGPVILISRDDYNVVGGHESVRTSIVEDMELGARLKNVGIPYRLFIGDRDVSFRMYSGGLLSLLQGWTKNMGTGAIKTPLHVFLMVFLWIASIISVPLHIFKFAVAADIPWLSVYIFLYVVWAFVLSLIARRVGEFQLWSFVLFPVCTLSMLGLFSISVFNKVLGRKVIWKDRAIETRVRP